jgi:pyruvate dehydrogenase E2 component (dihydrolipoamide acetyltransferase)/2-oxoisovalerate dehydrogenase E2 component (dihydrolipoyl transacylase)
MEFQLPELGEGVYEAELVAWQVKPGDAIKRGQILMEVLTDKATMEVPSPFAGTVQKLNAEPGQQLKVGDTVLDYQEVSGGERAEKPKERKARPAQEMEDQQEEAEIPSERKAVKAKPADEADQQESKGEKPAERKPVKTKPADEADEGEQEEDGEEAEQPEEHKPAKPAIKKEEEEEEAETLPQRKPAKPAPALAKAVNGPTAIKAAPSVRLMARKLGIDISRISGSGPDGRILIEDLSRQVKPSRREPGAGEEKPPFDYGKPGQHIKLVGVRRKIAEHLVHAKQVIPHYGYVDECDVSELVRIRAGLREPFQAAGVKITYLPFFIKAAVHALKEVPLVNSSLEDQAGEIVLHDRYHIGIAVATPAGLMVPVVHDADKKNLLEIAREVERLGNEARAGKSKREDLLGGTFTITSVGNIGGLFSTPIIHHPQAGILGIAKIVKRPVFDESGQICAADMVYLSFSFDHRVVDGAVGAVFGNMVKKFLENPVAMLMPG